MGAFGEVSVVECVGEGVEGGVHIGEQAQVQFQLLWTDGLLR